MPAGFDAYVRVLHPFVGSDGEALGWHDVAAMLGIELTPEVDGYLLTSGATDMARRSATGALVPPTAGDLPNDIAGRLVTSLSNHTDQPSNCMFAVWEGRAFLDLVEPRAAQFETRQPQRTWFLYSGDLTTVPAIPIPGAGFSVIPNLWWPADRTWFVGTEVDARCTYVGCSRDAAEALRDCLPETMPAAPHGPLLG